MLYTKLQIAQYCKLTPVEESIFRGVLKEDEDWPELTTNPRVNWAVDCYTMEELFEYNAEEYEEEIRNDSLL